MTTTEPSAAENPATLFPAPAGSGAGPGPGAGAAGPGPRGGTTLPGKAASVLESPLLWVLWGLAMAAMGVRVPEWTWPPGAARLVGFTACAVAGAVLARPHTGRPVIDSARWHNVLLLHRNTLLSAGFVVLVATEPPKVWEAAVDAALLAGYLLMLDAVTMPVPVLRRVAGPWFLLGLAGLVAAATAIVALPGSDATVRKVVVAVAAATVLTVAVAAGFRAGDTRRVGSRGIPKADPKK